MTKAGKEANDLGTSSAKGKVGVLTWPKSPFEESGADTIDKIRSMT